MDGNISSSSSSKKEKEKENGKEERSDNEDVDAVVDTNSQNGYHHLDPHSKSIAAAAGSAAKRLRHSVPAAAMSEEGEKSGDKKLTRSAAAGSF
mmetsp:Transcript_24570/g.44158  ORF Transcript_24570/g.44158 Transcript_24570/m.44158 type:complete len:94 (-) Transcript_24570:12-293(-)